MIILYSTDGCHLCEDAQALLDQVAVSYQVTDIIDDETLVARYGTTIPVVADSQGNELNWPFSLEQLRSFLD
ncbi:glutaredoxin family protein [Psychrobium sp. 1_MG-2023]|uniref:glutaredoxin family protein n=1 Tax=Psychrobium sp. 1_MG-2023 TaxID=3062624 RepID=UPI000C32C620|nr:glutaredoxin family protein [Psychrobium sp. 1_MG-2023]MDP2560352.1 glutaredoxin family protein [Psychrobium sp. 1_MG-2023]PKF55461.1 thioredoxin family protein [Alteromonadales bacterium alter-6D02]